MTRSRKNRRRRVEISGPSARNVHLLPVASDLPGVLRDSSRSDQIEEVNGIINLIPLTFFSNLIFHLSPKLW